MRGQHPRPDFRRSHWQNLNGVWQFGFDDDDLGIDARWFADAAHLERDILVPFVHQSALSGIDDGTYHPILWYGRRFESLRLATATGRTFLCFGAVDYRAEVWVNGVYIGSHQGGYTPFSFDVTPALKSGEDNLLVVRVEDYHDCDQPRGKQYWKESNDRCWYTPSSGIWQTVWLEERAPLHVQSIAMTPNLANSSIKIEAQLNKHPSSPATCAVEITREGRCVQKATIQAHRRSIEWEVPLLEDDYIDEVHYWSPEHPNLYEVSFSLEGAGGTDTITSYFGMRSITIVDGQILLNNKPFYQKLILHQGYWEGSLLTAASDEAYVQDITLIKQMGFNGVRLHQKIEDPRFYYWADTLGLVVWAEMPSTYAFNPVANKNLLDDLRQFIERDRNHPSIICWVPFNESWGIRNIYANKEQQNFAQMVYQYIKILDPSRLISTNDGWEQVESDICAIHDYQSDGTRLGELFKDLDALLRSSAQGRMIYASGHSYTGQPILITEFGGVAFSGDLEGVNWGYSESVGSQEEFLARLKDLVTALREEPRIQGYCYTQFSDVMQEVNGLVTIDRKPKCAIEDLKRIFSS